MQNKNRYDTIGIADNDKKITIGYKPCIMGFLVKKYKYGGEEDGKKSCFGRCLPYSNRHYGRGLEHYTGSGAGSNRYQGGA